MKVFSPKLRFKSMNFSRTTSTNFLTKSTKFFNTSRNQKSISNGFGSSFESIKTFKNFSPSIKKNYSKRQSINLNNIKKTQKNLWQKN